MINPDTIANLNEKLDVILANSGLILPEFTLAVFIILLIIFDLIFKQTNRTIFVVTALTGVAATMVFLFLQWPLLNGTSHDSYIFGGILNPDQFAWLFKLLFAFAGIITIFLSIRYRSASQSQSLQYFSRIGEYFVLLLGVILGASLLAMTTHLLMIYLAIELISLASYILAGLNFNKKSMEGSLKYILYGAVASGIMLYGMSLLYGSTGTLHLPNMAFSGGLQATPALLVLIGGLFTLGGMLFKIAVFPFHVWAPDVYQGAPTPVAAFFSVVPKLAGMVILIRFANIFDPEPLGWLAGYFNWQLILSWIAIITITVGNFAALWQNNAKRMLAYSSIAHSGFMLIGILAFSSSGIKSFIFYAFIYLLMNFSAFFILQVLSNKTGREEMNSYSGLGKIYPGIGIAMILTMIALTGLPPTAGFTAKLFIFSSLWESYQVNQQQLLLIIFVAGLFNTVISLFYYLKIPYLMFFKELPNQKTLSNVSLRGKINTFDYVLSWILVAPVMFFFFKADWVFNLIDQINLTLLD